MRKLLLTLSALGLVAGSVPSLAAAPCRDAHGKYMKCPQKPEAKQCRDAKGKFLKCKK